MRCSQSQRRACRCGAVQWAPDREKTQLSTLICGRIRALQILFSYPISSYLNSWLSQSGFSDRHLIARMNACFCLYAHVNWYKITIHLYIYYVLNWILSFMQSWALCKSFSLWFVNSLHMLIYIRALTLVTAAFTIIFHWNTCVLSPHAAAAKTGCVCCFMTGYRHT